MRMLSTPDSIGRDTGRERHSIIFLFRKEVQSRAWERGPHDLNGARAKVNLDRFWVRYTRFVYDMTRGTERIVSPLLHL